MKCPLCQKWYHCHCTKMTKKQSRKVFRSNEHYYCYKCINEILPFSNQKSVDPDKAPKKVSEVIIRDKKLNIDDDIVDKNCESRVDQGPPFLKILRHF